MHISMALENSGNYGSQRPSEPWSIMSNIMDIMNREKTNKLQQLDVYY